MDPITAALAAVAAATQQLEAVTGAVNLRIQQVTGERDALDSEVNRLGMTVAQLEDQVETIPALVAERDALRAEVEALRPVPGDRLDVAAVEDVWVGAKLILLGRNDPVLTAKWNEVAKIVDPQLDEAKKSGGVRKTVAWLPAVIQMGLADELVTTGQLIAAGLMAPPA